MRQAVLSLAICVLLLGCLRPEYVDNRDSRDLRIKNQRRAKVTQGFQLINNLTVIPLRINDSGSLNFILDTGVNNTLISELNSDQEFSINYVREVQIIGLGALEPIRALFSAGNEIFLKGIEGENQNVLLLDDAPFSLSNFMGTYVNGLIGYDVFSNFIVETDYQRERVHFYDPDIFSKEYHRRAESTEWEKIDLEIINNKPYVEGEIDQLNGTSLKVKLLIDSGASHSLFIYPHTSDQIYIPEKSVDSYLGSGLSGELYGRISRAESVRIGKVTLQKPILSFPNEEGVKQILEISDRNGSLGADVLKKFTVIMNYADSSMLLRPNKWFEEGFRYNMSGLEISTPLVELPYYEIVKVRKGSPADSAGIRVGDVIYSINGRRAYDLSYSEVIGTFQERDNKLIWLNIFREGTFMNVSFRLKDETI